MHSWYTEIVKQDRYTHPGMLLLVLFCIACVSFGFYFSQHAVVFQFPREITNVLIRSNSPVSPTPQFPQTTAGQLVIVEKVIDGDTIHVKMDEQNVVVRFIGVNAPEVYKGKSPECFAEESFQYVKNRIEGKNISLIPDTTQENKDIYERLLRYIILEDGTNLNLELIQKGYAREYTYKIPYLYQQEFRAAQGVAKNTLVGLWKKCK